MRIIVTIGLLSHVPCPLDRPNGKTALMKALLNLKNGDNKAVEHLLGIAERMGHLDKLVNAAYTDPYYEGMKI